MSHRNPGDSPCQNEVEAIARRAYRIIGERFPICAASDEFYFFPQVLNAHRPWSSWDDFSPGEVERTADQCRELENALLALPAGDLEPDQQIDAELLAGTLRNLREQLLEVGPQRNQPTFHLTVVAAGLAESLTAADAAAWSDRLAGLPNFLERAANCLQQVPRLFLQAGRDMLGDLLLWADQLQRSGRQINGLQGALEGYGRALETMSGTENFRMPEGLLSRVVACHMDAGMTMERATEVLWEEFHAMQEVLKEESARLTAGRDWRAADAELPFCRAPKGGLLELYRQELSRLEDHCREQGLVPETLSGSGSLHLQAVPAHLAAIRASDAYSAFPGHPPRGGVFSVMQEPASRTRQAVGRSLEYRLTAVHEAWPGHHLLDLARWNLTRQMRRPIEHPMFYEGWACLAEELMARTGYLHNPWDRFLLARRRLTRAARGLVDIGLQSGTMALPKAVELLVRAGYSSHTAQTVIPKYLLRPGYQLCYTIGLRQGLRLLEEQGAKGVDNFVRQVLAQGEIGFARLSRVLQQESAG